MNDKPNPQLTLSAQLLAEIRRLVDSFSPAVRSREVATTNNA